ncbi:hypothetical protein [Bradyrhizobium sp. CCBAU 11357]|uniref:hypothetical protein n=1 Tax=Bradyrhizobium sp. CCBAU 11357 TaxID=1630808 RepID=UPI00230290EA|nr:hypothetical protein [Bradyrhizobium sp. CCBAU 11357]MDA9502498.1 hypothetical protein [Bradyrhizobium sp. CCBAU 11357]
MLRILGRRASPMRLLGLAAAATLMLSAGSARRAEALTLINPATSPVTKAATDDLVTQVRHGGHGGHGGGGHFHGGGFRGGVGHIGGFRGGGFHGGGFRAAPAFHHSHVGGYRYGGFRYGGYGGYHRHWGHHRPHYGYRHFHRRHYYGGYYPYYHYPRRCRIIWTYYGPRRVCRWPRWHYPYRYYW